MKKRLLNKRERKEEEQEIPEYTYVSTGILTVVSKNKDTVNLEYKSHNNTDILHPSMSIAHWIRLCNNCSWIEKWEKKDRKNALNVAIETFYSQKKV